MTQAARIDLATTIHKGVRKLLFEQAMRLARCDFLSDTAWHGVCDALDSTFLMLREHADHEDIIVSPTLAELDRNLADEADRQHRALEQRMRDVERTCSKLRFAAHADRPELGNRLIRQFNELVVAELAHLAFEEGEQQELLWREKTDLELLAIGVAIRSLLTPARRKAWAELLRSAADPVELSALGAPAAPLVA